jgi:hypothetical protein
MFMRRRTLGQNDSIFQVEIIQHMNNELISNTIFKKSTGDSDFTSQKSGAMIIEKIYSFDTLIHVIEGKAEVVTDDRYHILEPGKYIIIPANTFYKEKGSAIFKMTFMRIILGYNMDQFLSDFPDRKRMERLKW